jgi:glycosyltransferase involved in cell wall biosynthesis
VPSGINIERFQPRNKQAARQQCLLPEDKFLVGVIAGLRHAKGHHLLLERVKRLHEDIMFVFVGGGPEFAALQQQCAEEGIQDRVIMVGHQANPEVWFPAFDLFISPSFYDEGIPQGVMQAQACGIATIATDAGATRDVITHNQSGLLIPMHDTDAIQHAIETLYSDDALRGRVADQGYKNLKAGFTQDCMLDAMESIFSRAIHEAGWDRREPIAPALSDIA